jgi:hypothetical protein
VSSIELGSAASAFSQSSRDLGTQTRTAKLRLLSNSSVIVTPGDDSGHALMSFPVHVQMPVEHISEHGCDVDPGSQSLLLSSVEPDLVPPPISPKLGPRGSERSLERHEFPGWPDDRPSRSSHRQESASHLGSHPLSSRLSSSLPSGPNLNHPTPTAIERSDDFFNVMDHYTGDNVHQMQTRRELTARLDVPVQPYSATEQGAPHVIIPGLIMFRRHTRLLKYTRYQPSQPIPTSDRLVFCVQDTIDHLQIHVTFAGCSHQ